MFTDANHMVAQALFRDVVNVLKTTGPGGLRHGGHHCQTESDVAASLKTKIQERRYYL